MPMRAWNRMLYFDPMTGQDGVCYQGFSGHGTYYIREPLAAAGRARRDQKERVLDLIAAAIELDDEAIKRGEAAAPGEVTLKEVPTRLRKDEDAWLSQT